MTHQPAISFSNSFHFPINRAGGRTSNVRQRIQMIAFIVEILFFGFCGWLGHVAVKIVTFGKVDLDYGDSSESVITEWIGVGVLLAIAMLISFLINANRDEASAKLIPVGRQIRCCTTHNRCLPTDAQQTIQPNWRTRRGWATPTSPLFRRRFSVTPTSITVSTLAPAGRVASA